MNENHVFADVEQPFHVWVREGKRWVLRDAGVHLQERNGHMGRGGDGNERSGTPSGAP
jgi:hypothetical protein